MYEQSVTVRYSTDQACQAEELAEVIRLILRQDQARGIRVSVKHEQWSIGDQVTGENWMLLPPGAVIVQHNTDVSRSATMHPTGRLLRNRPSDYPSSLTWDAYTIGPPLSHEEWTLESLGHLYG